MLDKLDNMYNKQVELQNKLNSVDKIFSSERMRQSFINQMILAVIEESVEIMRETKYKNPEVTDFGWKKGQLFNEEKFKKEIVDLMHFFLNLCIAAKMEPTELYNLYMEKNKENHVRKETGY